MPVRTVACLLFALVLLSSPLLAQTPPQRPMTTDDGLDLVSLGDVLLSPDGQTVFFSKQTLDWAKNKRKKTFYAMPADGGEAYQYIGDDGGSDFKFSPDGTYLSFKRSADSGGSEDDEEGGDEKKKSQLFVMRTSGGEAVQLTKHDAGVGDYAWAPDESGLFFVADEARTKEEQKEHDNGADAFFVDEGPNGQTEARWQNFWHVDLHSKEIRRLSKRDIRIDDIDVAPDGGAIVYTARTENRRNQSNLRELYVFRFADSTHIRLTENEAPEMRPQWSPDGRKIAYLAPSDETWELRNEKLWVMDPDGSDTRQVSGAFEGNIGRFVWTPDSDALLFNGEHRTNANLFRVEVSDGDLEALTEVTGDLQAEAFSKDRKRMVYSYESFSRPEDLYLAEVNDFDGDMAGSRLTTANPRVDSLITAEMEVVRWTSPDGTEIEGLLAVPPGYDGSERLPLLLHIHGGPAGHFGNTFRSQYHVWAGLGYAQLMPNVRGSSAYSDELLRGNMQDIGGGDYEDLMSGVDFVIERGIADPERLGVRGWSYGGILGGWTITQTDRFKAASLGAMVSDWTSEYGPGFNHDVRLWYIGGTPWENPEEWRAKSALTHVANVTTPTLIIHGMKDPVDTEPQSMMFFQALKDQGKTVRYLRVPREPHGFREPRHQRARDVVEIQWMEKYVRGKDWTPWTRKTKKQETPDAAVSSP